MASKSSTTPGGQLSAPPVPGRESPAPAPPSLPPPAAPLCNTSSSRCNRIPGACEEHKSTTGCTQSTTGCTPCGVGCHVSFCLLLSGREDIKLALLLQGRVCGTHARQQPKLHFFCPPRNEKTKKRKQRTRRFDQRTKALSVCTTAHAYNNTRWVCMHVRRFLSYPR